MVDAGISCRETEKRMLRLGLSMRLVKAIFVSHEHSDHINGIQVLAKKHSLPVYITPVTLQRGGLTLNDGPVIPFSAFETVCIGDLQVKAFPKIHDAGNPHSFLITCDDVTVGVFTDIGIACEQVVHHFKQCHAAFLEANYDEEMLENGGYPFHLKRRIRGGNGHLSNKQALDLFISHRSPFMSHLLLSHLSKNNNDPNLVQQLFDNHAHGTKIIVASRYKETEVYQVDGTTKTEHVKTVVLKTEYHQATLF